VTLGIDPRLEVRDLGPDLWIWRVLHPGWTEEADWQPIVTCTCVDLGHERLLLDPLVPPPDASPVWDRLDSRPPTAVVLLMADHVRPCWRVPADYQAAKRAGITIVLVPKLNKKDLDEIAPHLKRGLEIQLVDEVDEVLRLALIPPLEPRTIAGAGPKSTARTFPAKPRPKPVTV